MSSAIHAENVGFYPTQFNKLKGRNMLFKVEKCTGESFMFDGSFRVKRVCDQPSVVEAFNSIGVEFTHSEAVSDAPVTDRIVVNHVSESLDDFDAEEFVSNLIVSPNSVLDVNHEPEANDLSDDVYHLSGENEVAGAFEGVGDGEGSSVSVVVSEVVRPTRRIPGVKRSLAQAFVNIDSDDEPLSKKY